MNFTNKIVLVTGGTSGIGLKTSINFIKHDAKVVYVCGRSILKWDIAKVLIKKELKEKSNCIIFIQTDVRVEHEVKNLISQIFKNERQLDVCVNCAGVNTPPEYLWDTNFGFSDKKDDVITYKYYAGLEKTKQTPIYTNLIGNMFCLKWELKYIYKYNNPTKQVNIVLISSSIDELGSAEYPIYVASKAGVTSLTKSVACQVAKYKSQNENVPKIVINSVNPGYVNAPVLYDNVPEGTTNEQIVQLAKKQIPLGYIASTETISSFILQLSSPLTNYSTGSRFLIDGGLTVAFGYGDF